MLTVHSFTFSPIQENTYIISNSNNECIIIDPGCYYEEEREKLAAFIKQSNFKPIKLINTHCHLDHIFGNEFVYKTYGLEAHFHALEEQVLRFAPASGLMYGLPFETYTGSMHFLNPGDEISVGTDKLNILFTPGHSPGSLSFYAEADGFVIAGDALFAGSIGRTDLPGGDYDQLIVSIKTNLLTLPESTVVYSGHGPSTTIGAEKKSNPFLN